MSTTYGLSVNASQWTPLRSCIASPERASSGNLVLRVGREIQEGGPWRQREHVVLTRLEVRAFVRELSALGFVTPDLLTS